MKIKNPSFFGVAILLFSLCASAEETSGGKVGEQELAEKLRFYRNLTSFRVSFKQTKTLQDLNIKLQSEGILEVTRPGKILWQVNRPAALRVMLDQNEIRITSGTGANAQTQILKRSDTGADKSSEALTHLVSWMKLDAHALAEQYEITQKSVKVWKFMPKAGQSDVFQQLEMIVHPSGHLTQLIIAEKSGDILRIEFGVPKVR